MATLKTTLVLGSEKVTSVVDLITTIKKDLTVTEGGILVTEIDAVLESTAVSIFGACDYPLGTYIYLKNKDTTNTLQFKLSSINATDHQITLTPGQAAFFPWTAECPEENTGQNDIKVFASDVDTTLEYGAFN